MKFFQLSKLLFLLVLSGAAVAVSAAAADLRVGVAGDSPLLFSNNGGELTGFNADIARALCAEMGATCALAARTPEDVVAGLLAGDYDAAIASLPATEENAARVLLSDRYYRNGVKFVRRKGDKTKISYKGLAGHSVGVVGGTAADAFLSGEFDGADIRRYPSLPAALDALAGGDLSAVVGEQFAMAALAAESGEFELSGPTYNRKKYFSAAAVAVRPGDEDLQNRFSEAIRLLREKGIYREINREYFPFSIYGR